MSEKTDAVNMTKMVLLDDPPMIAFTNRSQYIFYKKLGPMQRSKQPSDFST